MIRNKALPTEDSVLELFKEGSISTGKAAELLGESAYGIQGLAKKHGVEIGASEQQEELARKNAEKLP